MFKNAIAFQCFTDKPAMEALELVLDANASEDIRSNEARRYGWTPVFESDDPAFTYHAEGAGITLFTMHSQERQLPGHVVKREVEKRADREFRETGVPLSRTQRTLLKEQVYEELLPRAFVKHSTTMVAWVQGVGVNWLIVDAGNRKTAERALDLLRESLGSLKVVPLSAGDDATPTGTVLTRLIDEPDDYLPATVELGDSCKMTHPSDRKRKITFKDTGLDLHEVSEVLASGAKVTDVELSFESTASLTLTDDLTFKSITFDDALIDDANEDEEPRMTGYLLSVHALLAVMATVLDLHKVQQ